MSTVPARYRKGDYRRACNICGSLEWFSTMKYIGQNRWACDVDAPGLTEVQIARHNAKVKPLTVKPRKHPFPATQVGEYHNQEALIFQLVLGNGLIRTNVSPTGAGAAAVSGQRLGACAVYLSDIINEGERPTSWIVRATAGLRAFADAILAQQYGSATGPSPAEATSSVLYGGILDTASSFTVIGQSYCGIALLRAYALFGDGKYLDGANAAVAFLRTLQRWDAVSVALSPVSLYVGGFLDSVTTTKAPTARFSTSGCFALWFLAELKAAVGGAATFGVAGAGGDFLAGTATSLDTMMADARAFYAGGRLSGWSIAPSSGTFGPLAPLSATTPREYYDPTAGLFQIRTLSTFPEAVTGIGFAFALRGLFEYEGYSATVASVYEWLMSFSSNPAAEHV